TAVPSVSFQEGSSLLYAAIFALPGITFGFPSMLHLFQHVKHTVEIGSPVFVEGKHLVAVRSGNRKREVYLFEPEHIGESVSKLRPRIADIGHVFGKRNYLIAVQVPELD